MSFGDDQLERITQLAADGGVEDRQRGAGAGTSRPERAVDEYILRVSKKYLGGFRFVRRGNSRRVIADSEILLHHCNQHQHLEVGFRVIELLRALPETRAPTVGFLPDFPGHGFDEAQAGLDI